MSEELYRAVQGVYLICRTVLPEFSHKYSPKKFTVPQRAAICRLGNLRGMSDFDVVFEILSQSDPVVREYGRRLRAEPNDADEIHLRDSDVLSEVKQIAQHLYPRVIRRLPKSGYRGVIAWLRTDQELMRRLELRRLPHYSALAHFEQRLRAKSSTTVTECPPDRSSSGITE